jgi:hypothetical protein
MNAWIVVGGAVSAFAALMGMLMLEDWQKYRRWKQRHEARNRYLSSLKTDIETEDI